MTIIDEYLYHQEKYEKKYGKDKSLVLMQVGSFHEAYSTNDRGFNLNKLSEILNLICTRKNKSIPEVSLKNPNMLGFPSIALQKYLKILIEHGFTIIIIDQVTPPPEPKRAVTGIYSPGTYLKESFSPDSNNIVSIYIEEEIQKNSKVLMCIGMSVVDLSTGSNTVYESYSKKDDEKYSMDDAVRFINSFNPKEILIHRKKFKKDSIKTIDKDKLINYLEIGNKNYNYKEKFNNKYNKISFQNEFLKRIFPKTGMLSPIEYLNLEKLPYAIISYLILMDFAYQHNENIVKNLYKPIIFEEKKHLILGNNAIFQLNILENSIQEGPYKKIKSLFDVINNTSTAMGRRFLKSCLVAPLISEKKINERYNLIETMIEDNYYKDIEVNLKSIFDLERTHRKISLNILNPQEYVDFISSYKEVVEIILKILPKKKLNSIKPDKKTIKQINNFIKYSKNTFDLEEMKKYNLNDIDNSFFKKNIHTELDKIQNKINNSIIFFDNVCSKLSELIDEKKVSKNNDTKIYLKKNDRDGYYLSLTKLRSKSLQNNLKKMKKIQINDTTEIKTENLIFKNLSKGNSKIFFNLDNKSDDLIILKTKIKLLTKEYYINTLNEIFVKFSEMFNRVTKFISIIDFSVSGAKTAIKYGYNKPKICKKKKYENGFICCKKLRHPIIERINEDIEYIPHDINIGFNFSKKDKKNQINGMLIYGLNSVGKSSLMKSLGINLIMAQCGLYVAAEKFKYSTYDSIFARITGNDNIFKGLSSFALEMTELRSILNRTGPRTLVIGDEVCRGTEYTSANSIVAASIINLSKTNSSFIFATHLHDIPKLTKIKELKNVKSYHLTVNYDKEKDILIFDRKLKEGSGDSVYGITVAKYIIHDKKFMKLAQEIKNEILKKPNELLVNKTSKYNSDIFIDKCEVCSKKVKDVNELIGYFDTHHINFQKDCKDGFVKKKPYLKMNSKANLIVLCKKCHYDVHHNNLEIKGYDVTSDGRKLKFKFLNKKNKIK